MAIADTGKQLKKLIKERKKHHLEMKGDRFPDEHGYCDQYFFGVERRLKKIYNEELTPYISGAIFRNASSWYLGNFQYAIIAHKDIQKATEYYASYAAYSYLTLLEEMLQAHYGNVHGIWPDVFYEMISSLCIAGWEREYIQVNEWVIESIAYGREQTPRGSIDKLFYGTGYESCITSWFLLDLYCLAYDREYDKANALYPESMTPYDQVLKAWDTTDMDKVDKLVYILCENHILNTEEEKSEEDYFAFDDPDYWLYPYEVHMWLALRELKGLENPKSFTHPLMKNEITRFICNLSRPLSYPETLPYAYELMKMIEGICSMTEIPEWVTEQTDIRPQTEGYPNPQPTIPEDFLD